MIPIFTRDQISAVMRPADVIRVVEEGFKAYSCGQTVIPSPGHLEFQSPEGDCHIKYGYRVGDPTFTIKIATGFPGNLTKALPTSTGVILIFSTQTGELLAILLDEGYLTDIRTAAAGALAAKLLAPSFVERIGIIGTGTQAKLHLEYLKEILPTRKAMVWSRSRERAEKYVVSGFEIEVATSCAELAARCQVVVSTTPSRQWLLSASEVGPGTHITAVGADGGGKQELAPDLFAKAAVIAVDSRKQCARFGDSSYALKERLIQLEDLTELGELLGRAKPARQNDLQITIADLTGVAIQDIQVATLALGLLTGCQ
jgi:ornithine cyclodeaminase